MFIFLCAAKGKCKKNKINPNRLKIQKRKTIQDSVLLYIYKW